MDPVNYATIIVALIAAAGAWASQRAAAKATANNTMAGSRIDMEKEAYDRARAFDTETISRQNFEIDEIRAEHRLCKETISQMKKTYEEEISLLRSRIARLERDTVFNVEEILRERLRNSPITDPDPDPPVR